MPYRIWPGLSETKPFTFRVLGRDALLRDSGIEPTTAACAEVVQDSLAIRPSVAVRTSREMSSLVG